jgi:hypothetical protein
MHVDLSIKPKDLIVVLIGHFFFHIHIDVKVSIWKTKVTRVHIRGHLICKRNFVIEKVVYMRLQLSSVFLPRDLACKINVAEDVLHDT